MKTLNKWAVVLMLAVVSVAGCGGVSEVQLGALLSLEGRASSYGQSIQRGIGLLGPGSPCRDPL